MQVMVHYLIQILHANFASCSRKVVTLSGKGELFSWNTCSSAVMKAPKNSFLAFLAFTEKNCGLLFVRNDDGLRHREEAKMGENLYAPLAKNAFEFCTCRNKIRWKFFCIMRQSHGSLDLTSSLQTF